MCSWCLAAGSFAYRCDGDKQSSTALLALQPQHLQAVVRQQGKRVKPTPDSRLNLSDIPEATDEQLRRARRVGRPATGKAKQLIAIRISPRLLAQLRRLAAKQSKPYQTLIHDLLERAANAPTRR